MDVLETALRICGRCDAEVFRVLGVPGLGEVLDGQVAGKEVALDLETGEDVQVVGALVSLDSDEAGLDLVDCPVPSGEV